jgi:hypothetical protein
MQMAKFLLALLAFWLMAAVCAGEDRQEPTAEQIRFFETKIRPVLVEQCYSCHSAEAKDLKAALQVDHRAGLLSGGDSGPAVVPGKPDESLLVKAIKYEDIEMPPKGKLPADVIADFERWVSMGLPDPRFGEDVRVASKIDIEAGRKFWAFRPVGGGTVPTVASGEPRVQGSGFRVQDEIDAFIGERLRKEKLLMSPEADKATWLRRVTFDLVGLPPSIEEIDAFVADQAADAHEKVVDRLLASPHFGERWGRHWLDIARFAESSGGGRSLVFKDAWRYRDYVIEAFNRDQPLDEFIVEQIAGDLLPHATPEEEHRHLVATGYLLLGAHNYEEQDKQQLEMDIVDEQLDTMGRGLLGMTLSCARCHDHKFDPIPTADYYAMAGILRSTDVVIHENVSRWTTRRLPMEPEAVAALDEHKDKVAKLKKEVDAAKKQKAPAKDIKALETKLKILREDAPPELEAMAAADAKKVEDCKICVRGSVRQRGNTVPRGVLQVATLDVPPTMPAKESGRRELAAWIASPKNPLTPRVYVNRVWHYLFGAGIVLTLDNFGSTGETPSHPELLDFLAARFMDENWSTKKLVRRLVLSRAYRMSTADNSHAAAIDPENRLLWRANLRRLDAESLRDAMLVASGKLDLQVGGPNILDTKVLHVAKADVPTEYSYQFKDARRSVYTPAFRNRVHELFEVFDFASNNAAVAERTVTTVSPQALWMLNSPFVMEQAGAAAELALSRDEADDARIERAFRVTLGRRPTAGEIEIAKKSLAGGEDRTAAWDRLFQGLFGCLDFRYLN